MDGDYNGDDFPRYNVDISRRSLTSKGGYMKGGQVTTFGR
jgi:hypothetical protein